MEININEVSMENQTNDYTNLLEATEVDYAMIELRYNQWMCIEDYLFHKAAKAEGKVLLEDVTVNPRNEADKEASKKNVPKGQAFMAKIKEMIQTFVNFMKSVIYKFMDKVQELLKLNTGWFEKNAYKIDGISSDFWNDCNIDCYPYIYGAKNNTDIFAKNIFSNGSKFQSYQNSTVTKRIDEGFENDAQMREYVASEIHKLDNESFVNGAKIFYRGDKVVRNFTGSQAKELCKAFVSYIKEYKSTAKNIQNGANEATKYVAELERKYNPDGTLKEGFIAADNILLYSILEDMQIQYGELKDLSLEDASGMEYIIMEAEVAADKKPSNGSVNMDPKGSNEKEAVTNKGASNTGSQTLSRRMKYWRLVADMNTARMTIAEECYNCAIRTLKAVIRNAENRGQIQFRDNDIPEEQKKAQAEAKKDANAKAATSSDTAQARG